MRSAPDLAYRYRPDWRQRASALLLSIGLAGLIVLALLRLGLLPSSDRPPESDLTIFDVSPPGPTAGGATATPDPAPDPAAKAAPERAATSDAAPPPPPPPLPPIPRPADTPALAFPDILILRGDQFAHSDIGRIPGTARGSGANAGGATTGDADTASAYGPGEGPGGERLFNAEWHVEPTNAQLTGYLPPTGAPSGSWATIACRTIERYEVENCRALSESPVGSGLARAMRQAAWQFRVRPPRIGGRPQIGAWVRIRITFDARPD